MRFWTFIAVLAAFAVLAGCAQKIPDAQVFDDSAYAKDVEEEIAAPPPPLSMTPGSPTPAGLTPTPGAGETPVATPPPAATPAGGGNGQMAEFTTAFGKKLTEFDTAVNENKGEAVEKLAKDLRDDFNKIMIIKTIKAEASLKDSVDMVSRKLDELGRAVAEANADQIKKNMMIVATSWRPIMSWMRSNADASVEPDKAVAPEKKPEDGGEESPDNKPAGDKPKTGGPKSGWEDEGGDESGPKGPAVPKDEKPEEE